MGNFSKTWFLKLTKRKKKRKESLKIKSDLIYKIIVKYRPYLESTSSKLCMYIKQSEKYKT